MNISVDWLDEHQALICFTFHSRWTLYDLRAAFEQANQMIGSVHHRVDFMFDLRASRTLISTAISFFNQLGIQTAPLNRGTTIVVGDAVTNRICHSVMLRLHPIAIRNLDWQFATSIVEAQQMLNSQYAVH